MGKDEYKLTWEQIMEGHQRAHGLEGDRRMLERLIEAKQQQILEYQRDLDNVNAMITFLRSLGDTKLE